MKDNKINIKVGYDKLTQDEINQGKDFNKLYKNYTVMKKSWFKSPSGIGGVASVVVIVTVAVTITVTKLKKQETAVPQKAVVVNTAGKVMQAPQHKFISPPIKGADIAYKTYMVNAEKGGELSYGAKTKIHIPKNCFVDKNGKEVKGNVAIKYREFHTPIDFFLSGIPMTYDSNGKQYTFQSAGMFDIRGSKDGEAIQVKPGKEIKVDMASVGKGSNYNTYELDTVQQKWVFTGKSKMAKPPLENPPAPPAQNIVSPDQDKIALLKNNLTILQKDEKAAVVTAPVKPKKADPNYYSLDINASAKDFPELAIYKGVWFQVDGSDQSYDPKYADETWSSGSLKRKTADTYVFTVSGDGETHSFIVHPVVDGKNYDAAMKKYDEKYAAYQKSIADQKAKEEQEEAEYQAMLDKQAKEAQLLQEQYQKQLLTANTENGIENFFTVRSFGIWNNDCPNNLPQGAEFAAFFTDNKKDDLSGYDVYMIEKGKNALYIYHPAHPFCYDPSKENIAWCINKNNEIAVLSPEEFQKIKERSGDRVFTMQVQDKKIQSQEDIKTLFKSFL